jgi:hypothetical protein
MHYRGIAQDQAQNVGRADDRGLPAFFHAEIDSLWRRVAAAVARLTALHRVHVALIRGISERA